MRCAMSEDSRQHEQEDYVHTHLSGVAFHVHCVGLGCHVVIGVGRLIVKCHHVYVIPSFLLDVVVRIYLVIVNSNCSQIVAHFCIAKTGHLRCCLYTFTIILITASLSSNTHTTKLLDAKIGRWREQGQHYSKH